MATFLRITNPQACRLIISSMRNANHSVIPTASIFTSKKKKDSVTVTETIQSPKKINDVGTRLDEKPENWISHGYDITDREEDDFQHHMYLFFGIGALCWSAFLLAYFPDLRLRNWTQREAYLQLEKRQKEGLPLIDPNIIDPAKVELPSEEELGDFKIVI